jgi:hypothetical protein
MIKRWDRCREASPALSQASSMKKGRRLATGAPSLRDGSEPQVRSKRSSIITLFQAATKSFTNFA